MIRENICKNIFVTGNTVIDSFQYTVRDTYQYKNDVLKKIDYSEKRTILMTAHRRENLGKPLENICNAVKRLIHDNVDIQIVYPVHLNPAVRETVYGILDGVERVYLTDPIDVEDMHNVMSESYMLMTDSGGLQEEGPHFGIPVMVLRSETERPEAVEAGTVCMAGIVEDDIYKIASELLHDHDKYMEMAKAVNPYGDGHASERIADAIIHWKKAKEEGHV